MMTSHSRKHILLAVGIAALVIAAAGSATRADIGILVPKTGACYSPACTNFVSESECHGLFSKDYWAGAGTLCNPKDIGIITTDDMFTTPLNEYDLPAITAELDRRCFENAHALARQKCDPKLTPSYFEVYPFQILDRTKIPTSRFLIKTDSWYVKCGMVIQCRKAPPAEKLGASSTPSTIPTKPPSPIGTPSR